MWIVNGRLLLKLRLSEKVQSWERRPRQKVKLNLKKSGKRRIRSEEQILGQKGKQDVMISYIYRGWRNG